MHRRDSRGAELEAFERDADVEERTGQLVQDKLRALLDGHDHQSGHFGRKTFGREGAPQTFKEGLFLLVRQDEKPGQDQGAVQHLN